MRKLRAFSLLRITSALAAVAVVFSACGSSTSTETDTISKDSTDSADLSTSSPVASNDGDEGAPVKVGVSIAMSGDQASSGESMLQGYKFWADRVNENGGIAIEGTKHPVELVVYDDESDPTTAARLASRLVDEDGVDFMFGPFSSALTLAVAPITSESGVVLIAGAGNADDVYNQGFKRFYSLLPVASTLPVYWFDAMVDLEPQPRSLGIVAKDDPFSASQAAGLKAAADAAGIDVSVDVVFPPESVDFSSIVSQLRTSEPDIVALLGHTGDGSRFISAMRDQDYLPNAYVVSAGTMSDLWDATGDAALGAMGISFYSPGVRLPDPLFADNVQFGEEFLAYAGHDADWLAASAAMSGSLLYQAIVSADSLDVDAVAEVLATSKIVTFNGEAQFDEDGRNVEAVAYIDQILQPGTSEIVAPSEAAVAEALYPIPRWSSR